MSYDILIKNGRIYDFSLGLRGEKRDLFVKDGVIVRPDSAGEAQAKKILDAGGCLVTPGLVDSHFHAFEGGNCVGAVYADLVAPAAGVTTVVDAGTSGPLNFKAFYKDCVVGSRTEVKALLHPAPLGVLWPALEEPENPAQFDVRRIRERFEEYEKTLVGLKIRCHRESTGGFGTAPVRKAVEIADNLNETGFHCAVTMHFGELEAGVSVDEAAACLRPGDIFAHFYQPCKTPVYDAGGKLYEGMLKGKERGVLFDACMGTSHYSLENIRRLLKAGFYPDIISSDLVSANAYIEPCFSLPYCMSLFLNEGMPLTEIFKATAYTPAKALGILGGAGTLGVGTRADIALFKLENKTKTIADRYGGAACWEQLLVPMATIKSGAVVFQQIFF